MTERYETTPSAHRSVYSGVPQKPPALPFFMVWSPQGSGPAKKHDSLLDAMAECKRLAGAHPDREFFVLQATYYVRLPKVDPIVTPL